MTQESKPDESNAGSKVEELSTEELKKAVGGVKPKTPIKMTSGDDSGSAGGTWSSGGSTGTGSYPYPTGRGTDVVPGTGKR